MHQDYSREKLDFALFCSKHPRQRLKISSDLTKTGASSAYEVNIKIVVYPCPQCKQEMDSIKEAVKTLVDFQKIDATD